MYGAINAPQTRDQKVKKKEKKNREKNANERILEQRLQRHWVQKRKNQKHIKYIDDK